MYLAYTVEVKTGIKTFTSRKKVADFNHAENLKRSLLITSQRNQKVDYSNFVIKDDDHVVIQKLL